MNIYKHPCTQTILLWGRMSRQLLKGLHSWTQVLLTNFAGNNKCMTAGVLQLWHPSLSLTFAVI